MVLYFNLMLLAEASDLYQMLSPAKLAKNYLFAFLNLYQLKSFYMSGIQGIPECSGGGGWWCMKELLPITPTIAGQIF